MLCSQLRTVVCCTLHAADTAAKPREAITGVCQPCLVEDATVTGALLTLDPDLTCKLSMQALE